MSPGSPARGTGRRWGARIALLVIGTIAALGLAEVVLRVVGFRFLLYPEHIEFGSPNPQEMKSEFVPHDRLLWVRPGYEETVRRAREERPALALMGCSATAWGRYDEALARRVAERRGGQELVYVNLAFPGWSSFQGLEQMRLDVREIAPRVVTIFYGWNDHWIGFGIDDATAARLNRSVLFPLQRLRIVQLANKALASRETGFAAEGASPRPLRVAPDAFRSNLEEMVDLAQSVGATPMLLTAPTSHRKGHEPRYLTRRWLERIEDLVPLHQRYVGIVREVAAEKDAPLCDLAAAAAGLDVRRRNALFHQDGIHFSEVGQEWAGELLYRCLEREGLFERLLPSRAGAVEVDSGKADPGP